MPDMKPTYLGDGLYVQLDRSGSIRLYTEREVGVYHEVFLDDRVLDAFLVWLKELRAQIMVEREDIAEKKK